MNSAPPSTPAPPREAPALLRLLPVRIAGWLAALAILPALIITPMTFEQQIVLSVGIFVAALITNRIKGRFASLVLIFMSVVVSSRYTYWRVTETMFMDNPVDLVLGIGLLMAELYAFVVLLLGYVQTAWPLERKPVPLPEDPAEWPTIDLFIPTYNEALSVVRSTVLAAQSIDWPRDKIKIFVLDDGRRDEFRVFCEDVGVTHVTRDNNRHAKAATSTPR